MLKKDAKLFYGIFLLLSIVFIPFTFHLFSIQKEVTNFIFGGLINSPITSDSKGMYELVLILFLLALIIFLFVLILDKKKTFKHKFISYSAIICRYYLVAIFLKYGFDKVFKTQFYQPEPNTLFTKLGNLDKDILYWSTIGSSYWHNVVTGSFEILVALFLLHKYTRQLGIIFLFFALAQILLINFSFDISVKLFSTLLLLMNIFIALPYLKNWTSVLFVKKPIELAFEYNNKSQKLILVKYVVVSIMFCEALYPSLSNYNFNDDKAKRQFLHGAYNVMSVVNNNDTLNPLQYPFKRFYIHRNGYLIFEDNTENMQDYSLKIDTTKKSLLLTNYNKKQTVLHYDFNSTDSTLTLQYFTNNILHTVQSKAIDYKKMNLLNDSFNWGAD